MSRCRATCPVALVILALSGVPLARQVLSRAGRTLRAMGKIHALCTKGGIGKWLGALGKGGVCVGVVLALLALAQPWGVAGVPTPPAAVADGDDVKTGTGG